MRHARHQRTRLSPLSGRTHNLQRTRLRKVSKASDYARGGTMVTRRRSDWRHVPRSGWLPTRAAGGCRLRFPATPQSLSLSGTRFLLSAHNKARRCPTCTRRHQAESPRCQNLRASADSSCREHLCRGRCCRGARSVVSLADIAGRGIRPGRCNTSIRRGMRSLRSWLCSAIRRNSLSLRCHTCCRMCRADRRS